MKDRIANSVPGALAADRLVRHHGSIYTAFDSLLLGFNHNDAIEYMEAPADAVGLPEEHRGHVAGMIMGFAIVAVEAERRRADKKGSWP